jgi:hypothetical protein
MIKQNTQEHLKSKDNNKEVTYTMEREFFATARGIYTMESFIMAFLKEWDTLSVLMAVSI